MSCLCAPRPETPRHPASDLGSAYLYHCVGWTETARQEQSRIQNEAEFEEDRGVEWKDEKGDGTFKPPRPRMRHGRREREYTKREMIE